jgi:HSP20 family protein
MAPIRRQETPQSGVARRALDPFEIMNELTRWDPFEELGRLTARRAEAFVPAFDVKETKDAYVFKADVPGLRDEDLELAVTGNRLTISGRREEDKRREDERMYAYERSYGTFSRSFVLPDGADDEHIDAELKNGVLTLTVPKKPEVQPRRIPLLGKRPEHKA